MSEPVKVVNILVDHVILAWNEPKKRVWTCKPTKITKVIIVDWDTKDFGWDEFKGTVIKLCNSEFYQVSEILRASDSGKEISLLWTPYVQDLKEFPTGVVKAYSAILDSDPLNDWLLLASLTKHQNKVGFSLVMQNPGSQPGCSCKTVQYSVVVFWCCTSADDFLIQLGCLNSQ